jgi:hypothetical protein
MRKKPTDKVRSFDRADDRERKTPEEQGDREGHGTEKEPQRKRQSMTSLPEGLKFVSDEDIVRRRTA